MWRDQIQNEIQNKILFPSKFFHHNKRKNGGKVIGTMLQYIDSPAAGRCMPVL